MSELQQEAVRMISKLSDDNVSFLIEIINRLMTGSEKCNETVTPFGEADRAIEAFRRLDIARSEIRQYLPDDFEPEKELEEARAERYGCLD